MIYYKNALLMIYYKNGSIRIFYKNPLHMFY